MKINVTVDLEELSTDFETVDAWVRELIKDDIKRQLKKSAEYKAYVVRQAEIAIATLDK